MGDSLAKGTDIHILLFVRPGIKSPFRVLFQFLQTQPKLEDSS